MQQLNLRRQCTDELYSCTSRFGQCSWPAALHASDSVQTVQLHFTLRTASSPTVQLHFTLRTVSRPIVQLHFTLQTVYRPTAQLHFTLRTVYRPTAQLHFTLRAVFRPVIGYTQPQTQWIPEALPLNVKLKLQSCGNQEYVE